LQQNPGTSSGWRPFNGDLWDRSIAHALCILGALMRWLVEQRYVLASPLAGVNTGGRSGAATQGRSMLHTRAST